MESGRVLGLDIGSQNLKIALLRRNGRGAVLSDFLLKEFPREAGENLAGRESLVVETVRDFLRQNGVRRAAAYCCLPTGAMGESTLQLPLVTGRELAQAVRMHVKNKLGGAQHPLSFDFHVTPDGPRARHGNVVVQLAVTSEDMPRALARMVEALGLRAKGVNIWGGVIENLIRGRKFVSGKCIAVLEIGAARSAIGIFRDGHLHFVREIGVGGNAFTKALTEMPIREATREFLDISAAERMKRRYGILVDGDGAGLRSEEAARFSAMLRPRIERLVLEAKRSIEYYRQLFHSGGVQELYLCGGGARLKNLAVYLSQQLGMDVKNLPVAECVKFSSESVAQRFEDDAMALAAAVGTALDDGKKINLLPTEVVTDRRIAKAKNLFQVLLIAGLVLMFYGRRQAGKELRGLKTTLGLQKEALSFMQDGLAEVEMLNRLRNELQSVEKALAERSEKRPDWVGVLKEISNIIPANIVLSEIVPASDSKQKSIVLRGNVLEEAIAKNLEVSEFLLRLEGSPFFKDVRLRPRENRQTEESGQAKKKFEINCVLAH